MTNRTTITDIPRKATEEDKFGLNAYEKGLELFLRGSETPITIALQGEWGSGKTSLMNVLLANLCGDSDGKTGEYFPVWINTWEFSLMRDPSEALKQILLKMTKEVMACCSTKNKEVAKSLIKGIWGLGTTVVKSVANTYLDGAGDKIEEFLTENVENGIADLRNALQSQINESLGEHPEKKGFIFFVDDLDRIDPPVAVELLELLKNIFTLENCIFVLAIDYDVVIKGLKPKFGDMNNNNEREFRSFFDKIIQVPFSMPVAQYQTRDYFIGELKRIGVISSQNEKNDVLLKNIENVEKWTIGSNPRSMKRFLNTLSLISCIGKARLLVDDKNVQCEEESDTAISTLLNVAIVGLQVAFPVVYQMLCVEPGFTLWDETVAAKMNVPRIDHDVVDRLKEFKEFDEEWEQVLYRLCLTDKYLHKNSINLSNLFNMLRDEILRSKDVNDSLGDSGDSESSKDDLILELIHEQLNKSSVTGLIAGDSAPLEYDKLSLFKYVHFNVCEYVREKFKNITGFGMPRKKCSGQIIPHSKGYPTLYLMQCDIDNGSKIQYRFRISTTQKSSTDTNVNSDMLQDISQFDCVYKDLFNDFEKKQKKLENYDCYRMWAEQHVKEGRVWFKMNFDVTFNSPNSFKEPETMKTMQEVAAIFFEFVFMFEKV
jgi:hypothetical protein